MTQQALQPDLETLVAKQAIRETIMRYCRAADRCDEEIARSCFHDDATVERGGNTVQGGDEIARWLVEASRKSSTASLHSVCNDLIEVTGDAAWGEFYFTAWWLIERDGKQFTRPAVGRYFDRFERRDGEWRIVHHAIVYELARVDELTEGWSPGANGPRGARSREDILYDYV